MDELIRTEYLERLDSYRDRPDLIKAVTLTSTLAPYKRAHAPAIGREKKWKVRKSEAGQSLDCRRVRRVKSAVLHELL